MTRGSASPLAQITAVLEIEPSGGRHSSRMGAFAARLAEGDPGDVWLALAILGCRLPTPEDVDATLRAITLDGPEATARKLVGSRLWAASIRRIFRPEVRVVSGVIVDVHHTAQTRLATGIQRVVRNVIVRWDRDQAPILVRWDKGGRTIRELSRREQLRLTGSAPRLRFRLHRRVILVPRNAVYVLPELAAEQGRTRRLAALAAYSTNHCTAIGFDCVPLTTAETAARGMGGLFAHYLAAIAHFDRVATISGAAGDEYRGWRKMLAGTGLKGPHIRDVLLPGSIDDSSEADLAEARGMFCRDALPVVLCVGSHEPRKNHLAVLAAAEILWSDGHEFALAFIGGNAWNAQRFLQQVTVLSEAGRPIFTASRLSDRLLWASYRIATCTVFPSLNEGFGLPVAESLMAGTPVVTSNFGSMRELAEGGGALLVNPREDAAVAEGILALLTDPNLRENLHRKALARAPRSWDDYARELWEYLVDVPYDMPGEITVNRARGGR
jgi:glycosyltransferase involved in cell wall biosynthesis